MIASYSKKIGDIELKPLKFLGHSWLYGYGGNDPDELSKLKASKEAFEVPDAPEKKNPSTVVLRSPAAGSGNKPPPRRKGCCGGRK